MLQLRTIGFCPEVKGPCIGESCAAYSKGLTVTITKPEAVHQLLRYVCGSAKYVSMDDVVNEFNPVSFLLDVQVCNRYNCFIDQDSLDLMISFDSHLHQNEQQVES